MTADGELMLSPKPKNKGNVLLITALSSHEKLIKKTLNVVKEDSPNSGKSVLSIIGMVTRISENTTKGMVEDPSHSCLIKLISDIRPDASKNHTVDSDIDYNISDHLRDLKNFFIHDMRGISAIVLFPSLILVLVYYNLPIINGFIDFLKQNLILIISLIIGVLGIPSAYFRYFHDFFKKKHKK